MAAKRTAKQPDEERGTFVRMRGELHRRAKLYSYDNKIPFRELIEAALDEYLRKRGC